MERDGKMGVCLDVPNDGYAGRLEVVEGRTGRKRRSDAEKVRIVAESLLPGARISDVARKNGATRWQVYDWRKRVRDGRLVLPESVAAVPAFAAVVGDAPTQRKKRPDAPIEIIIGDIVIRTAPASPIRLPALLGRGRAGTCA